MYCFVLTESKDHLSQAEKFVLRQFKFAEVQNGFPWSKYKFLPTFFTEKMFTNRLNMSLPQGHLVEHFIHEVETHKLSGKKKFRPSSQ